MSLIELNENVPRRNSRFGRFVGKSVVNILGWRVKGEFPQEKKFILAVAPHTSNWDFVVAVAVMLAIDLKTKFLGKASIFTWPFKGLLTGLGGIPVFRDSSHGVVSQLVEYCNSHDQFVLGIAPEGTRSKTKEWKSGFLQIANQANIPVVPVSLDFEKKEVFFQPAVSISEDIPAELAIFKRHFDGACAKIKQSV